MVLGLYNDRNFKIVGLDFFGTKQEWAHVPCCPRLASSRLLKPWLLLLKALFWWLSHQHNKYDIWSRSFKKPQCWLFKLCSQVVQSSWTCCRIFQTFWENTGCWLCIVHKYTSHYISAVTQCLYEARVLAIPVIIKPQDPWKSMWNKECRWFSESDSRFEKPCECPAESSKYV